MKDLYDQHNKLLAQLIDEKKEYLKQNHPKVKLKIIDLTNFFENLIKKKTYDNTTDLWYGTYKYPLLTGYMWWDSINPMSSIHKRIAERVQQELEQDGLKLGE